MSTARRQFRHLVYEGPDGDRFTQDSPIMPDVWFAFAEDPGARVDLLIEPYRGEPPGRVATELRQGLSAGSTTDAAFAAEIAFEESMVAARLTLREILLHALPLTPWWAEHVCLPEDLASADIESALAGRDGAKELTRDARWFFRIAGALLGAETKPKTRGKPRSWTRKVSAATTARTFEDLLPSLLRPRTAKPLIWAFHRNRPANLVVCDSRRTVKADAAERLFDFDVRDICWAIVDAGVDARHPAFRRRKPDGDLVALPETGSFEDRVRIRATYDFTRIRSILSNPANADLRRRIHEGRAVDWESLIDTLRVVHDEKYSDYVDDLHPHGTHVAGILGADWRRVDVGFEADDEADLRGLCPAIELYDLRVIGKDGKGDEFSILAALQFLRHLNDKGHSPVVHGANLSLSIPHDVSNFACGRTPVCNEVERLHASGVCVVVAAGNEGFVRMRTDDGGVDAYHDISITDPGNAEAVVTVGATHARRPHTYGVSYFSSRGPTGDGRMKPDLVAPGEKIKAPTPHDGYARLDGTSMAAPHVSGAAAILMSRHRELIGNPTRIKTVLCSSATDLGRERRFQGAGLVDVLRALQSV